MLRWNNVVENPLNSNLRSWLQHVSMMISMMTLDLPEAIFRKIYCRHFGPFRYMFSSFSREIIWVLSWMIFSISIPICSEWDNQWFWGTHLFGELPTSAFWTFCIRRASRKAAARPPWRTASWCYARPVTWCSCCGGGVSFGWWNGGSNGGSPVQLMSACFNSHGMSCYVMVCHGHP